MEGEVLTYHSDSDVEDGEDDPPTNHQRKRGIARVWSFVRLHDNLQSGFQSMNDSNVPILTRLKGRNNRGKTASYYYYCVKKSCGCNP